jgi:NADPH:quinone reductase
VHKGDRVAAFHVMRAPAGSYAEYAIAPQHLVFPIPEAVSFEEASTIPLAAYTAAVALFYHLEFPSPWDKAAKRNEKRPLVIYGASTAIGAFGIKLAQFANIHPIIAVGSKNSDFVVPFLNASKGDRIVDYTAYKTHEELTAAIKGAIKEAGAADGRGFDVFDGVSTTETVKVLTNAIAGPPDSSGRRPRLTTVLPDVSQEADASVEIVRTNVGTVHGETEEEKVLGLVWGRAFSRGLAEGWFTPHPYEVVKGGLGGLEGALRALKEGTVRGKKMVIRIGETEGVEA